MTRDRRRRGIIDHLLKNHMHEQEQGLRLHNQNDTFLVWIIIKVLMNTTIFDNQRIPCLPVDPAAIMNIMTLPF